MSFDRIRDALAEIDRLSDLRLELVKWRRWADDIVGGPGLLPDAECRQEIDRIRAEQAAGREHVERVVSDMATLRDKMKRIDEGERRVLADYDEACAERDDLRAQVAKLTEERDRMRRVVLSDEDVAELELCRFELNAWGQGVPLKVLDRLIAAGKPTL